MESSGAGGRSRSSSPRKRPAPLHPLVASSDDTISILIATAELWGVMAVNVPGPGKKRKGGL
jgi:hypothetical protein